MVMTIPIEYSVDVQHKIVLISLETYASSRRMNEYEKMSTAQA